MSHEQKRHIIMITDGDKVAKKTVEQVAQEIGGRCISVSAGNPTPISGEEIVEKILQAAYDPVLVMFDDCGQGGFGRGEAAMSVVATHPKINVLGAIAVASDTNAVSGTHIDLSVDAQGKIVKTGVNKDGNVEMSHELRIFGDTVDVLDTLPVPLIIGIGDIGKMHGRDAAAYGAPITKKAVEMILERSGYHGE